MTWAALAIAALSAAVLVLVYRNRATSGRAGEKAALLRLAALEAADARRAARAATVSEAADDERRRLEAALRDVRAELEAARRGLADFARDHPELARQYVDGVLRRAEAAGAAAPAGAGDATVPDVAGAAAQPGGPSGARH